MNFPGDLLSDIVETPVRDDRVHRAIPIHKETLRAAGGNAEMEDQVDSRLRTPVVLHHNRPVRKTVNKKNLGA